MAYRKRKRPSRRRSYKRGKRKLTRRGAATRVQKCVRRFITAKRARRSMRAYARRRVSRSMNSLSSMSKTYSFSTYLERHMVPQDNFFTDDTNQKITSAGIICSSKNNTAPSFAGQCNLALRCGPGGFFNVAQPINSFSPLNSRVDDVFSQWKSFKIISTTYTFEPVDLGRGDLDTERQSAAVTNNATSHIDTKNQLAWFVIDQGNRDIDPLELCGQRAWQAPLPGPPPAGILNSGKVYSLGSDTGNLCDTSVKRRLFSSSDRKPFKFTVYPPKRTSPLWQVQETLVSLTGIPTDVIKPGMWQQCDDWSKFRFGSWSSAAELLNNAKFGGINTHAPLSVGISAPIRYDYAGNFLQMPLWRVSVKQIIRFRGLRAT